MADDLKLFVHIIKRNDMDYEIAGLSEDKKVWYVLPGEFRKLNDHEVLSSKPTIKGAVSAIKPTNGFRKVGVKIDKALQLEYFDQDGNLSYKNFPLEELTLTSDVNRKFQNEMILSKKIEELELKLNSDFKLHEIEKQFILDKFDKTQNSIEWLSKFERECERHKVFTTQHIIETLRFFVFGSPKDWYDLNIQKIGLTDWPEWKRSFLAVFVDKGWGPVRKAFGYKHIGGSLVDYALRKEKLCLEAEPHSTVCSRINMIVIGLPYDVQNAIDREHVTTIEKLLTQLRKLDSTQHKKHDDFSNTDAKNIQMKPESSKPVMPKKIPRERSIRPCFMCEFLGWPNRVHLTRECRNKALYDSRKKEVNLNEAHHDFEPAQVMKIEFDEKSLN